MTATALAATPAIAHTADGLAGNYWLYGKPDGSTGKSVFKPLFSVLRPAATFPAQITDFTNITLTAPDGTEAFYQPGGDLAFDLSGDAPTAGGTTSNAVTFTASFSFTAGAEQVICLTLPATDALDGKAVTISINNNKAYLSQTFQSLVAGTCPSLRKAADK